ncbi:hypothetical protein DB121_03975 [Salmonella enterica]|nr:hypothetical protein [Salmonella enterica]
MSIKNDGHYFCGAGGNRPDGSDEALTDKPTLSWEKKEPQTDKNLYCLTPSDPGCSDMWYKEKLREHQERVQRYQLPKKRNFHK